MQPTLSQAEANRAEVNRANAQHSTGPKTDDGKKRARLNAHRHGLTGQILILPAEELAKFKTHCQNFRDRYKPQTPEEEELVQLLADTRWRIMRVPTIENNIQMLGAAKRRRYSGAEDDDLCLALATAAEFRDQTKALANLALYEQRLWRQYAKIEQRLEEAQSLRKESHPAANGSVFSSTEKPAPPASITPSTEAPLPPISVHPRPSAAEKSLESRFERPPSC